MSKFYTSVEQYGNNILWRGYENGRRFSRKIGFKPSLYIKDTNNSESSHYKDLFSKVPLKERIFDSIREASDFAERYKDVAGIEIFGSLNYVTQFIQKKYTDDIVFDFNSLNIFYYDIETDSSEGFPDMETADKAIVSISIKSSKKDTNILLGMKDYDQMLTETGIDPKNIRYEKFDTEKAMLLRFIDIWKNDYPDIVSGWNVAFFDVMYTITRIMRLFGDAKAKELSPWGILKKTSKKGKFGKEQSTYRIYGISVIDFMDAFIKFGYKYGTQESYKLDSIAHVVLGEKKLDYSEYSSLNELYEKNPQKFLDYNLKDTHLIERMEDETALLNLVATVAYGAGVNFGDAFGTVGIWESILYRRITSMGFMPKVKTSPGEHLGDLAGGFVKDPKPGMYKWIVSFDLNSLYPHLMLQYNMSPETFLEDVREDVSIDNILRKETDFSGKEYTVAPNGACFRKDVQGIIPSIIEEYYAERKILKTKQLQLEQKLQHAKTKKEKHDLNKEITQLFNGQMRIKIAMNSLYGATANRFFLYYIARMAEAITHGGQTSIQFVANALNGYLNTLLNTDEFDYVHYADTDSVYLNLEPLVNKFFTEEEQKDLGRVERFLDKICEEKLEKIIDKTYDELAHLVNAYKNAMKMKREKINDNAIFIAKKRYILNTLNSEGVHYETPKLSVTGVESVRSSTPEICRRKLDEAFKIIMNNDESKLHKFIEEFRKEFKALDPEDIGKTTGTDDIEKFKDKKNLYGKGCPIHVRGALIYNDHLVNTKLNNKYETIRSGDKVKFVYLKLPNPVHENVISFPGVLPDEFDIEKYIDYDLQFEKVFLKPLESILEIIDWTTEEKDTLEAFFS